MENLKSYPIFKANKVKTKYGESVQLDVGNHLIFLPNRYNIMSEEEIMELSSGNYHIKKEAGEDEKSYRLHLDYFDINIAYIIPENGQYPIWN